MALSLSSLSGALVDVLSAALPSVGEVAGALADAYVEYAAAGQFGASGLEIPPANRDALAATLEAALDPSVGTPATFGAAWAAALTTFWVGIPVVGAQAGATVGCPGAAALVTTIAAAVTNPVNTTEQAASAIAAALHAATQTVTAAVAPPPGTLPIA